MYQLILSFIAVGFLIGLLIPSFPVIADNYLSDYEYNGTVAFPHFDTLMNGGVWLLIQIADYGAMVGSWLGYPLNVIVGLGVVLGFMWLPRIIWGVIVLALAINHRKGFFKYIKNSEYKKDVWKAKEELNHAYAKKGKWLLLRLFILIIIAISVVLVFVI